MNKNFHKVLKLHWGYFRQGPKKVYSIPENWEKLSSYTTKKGIINIQEWSYRVGSRIERKTEFSTVVNEHYFAMSVDEVDMLEAQLKNLATRFLNNCHKYISVKNRLNAEQ